MSIYPIHPINRPCSQIVVQCMNSNYSCHPLEDIEDTFWCLAPSLGDSCNIGDIVSLCKCLYSSSLVNQGRNKVELGIWHIRDLSSRYTTACTITIVFSTNINKQYHITNPEEECFQAISTLIYQPFS